MNRTITRAFQTLRIVSEKDHGMTLKEITEELRVPKSSAFDIIQTLLNLKLLEVSKYNEKRYVLGIEAFSLGMKYSQNMNLVDVASQYTDPLADKLNRTTFVGILDETEIVYVHKYMGKSAKLATCNVGARHSLHSTSLGKALLAYVEDTEQERIINKIDFQKKTTNTISNKEDLKNELKEVREKGYSVDNKENEVHMICFGAPIFDYSSKVIAAISFSDMKSPEMSDADIGNQVKACAEMISRRLGYTGVYS